MVNAALCANAEPRGAYPGSAFPGTESLFPSAIVFFHCFSCFRQFQHGLTACSAGDKPAEVSAVWSARCSSISAPQSLFVSPYFKPRKMSRLKESPQCFHFRFFCCKESSDDGRRLLPTQQVSLALFISLLGFQHEA